MSFFVMASVISSLFAAPVPPLAPELTASYAAVALSAPAAAFPSKDEDDIPIKPRNGENASQVHELKNWLGPQAWKLAEDCRVLCVELFAGHGQ